jgi:hypothetical protein
VNHDKDNQKISLLHCKTGLFHMICNVLALVCYAVLESEGIKSQSMKPGIAATAAIVTPAILATQLV